MRQVILYIAMSLDGYIARPDGDVSWLHGQEENIPTLDTYSTFIETVDTILLGHKTYTQIMTTLSPNIWCYPAQTTYVITHHAIPNTAQIRFVNQSPAALVRTLQTQTGKDIWICGGASIIHPLIQENLIDVYRITLVPILLGDGIRLFDQPFQTLPLTLQSSITQNGMTELYLTRRAT